MAKDHFADLYQKLTTGSPTLFEVAEACLRFATLCTRDGYPFDSAAWRAVDGWKQLRDAIPLSIRWGLFDEDLQAIADAISGSKDRPLAAWVAAMHISTAISKNFTASDPYGPDYTLKDLQGFTVSTEGTSVLYRGTSGLSSQPGPDFNQNDPSAVDGLAVWRADPALHGSFEVVVDKACGTQFDAGIDEDNTLKVAVIQPNEHILELGVDTVSPASAPEPVFFGVRPINENDQTKKIVNGLKLAAMAGAGIALLPELVMTEKMVKQIVAALEPAGCILRPTADPHALRVVVSGSYHHRDANNKQWNTTQVHFPRTNPMVHRQHSKSGKFVFTRPRAIMEAWSTDPAVQGPALTAILNKSASTVDVDFREDVTPTNQIRLFSGAKFSAVVVICADLLNNTLLRVLQTLRPSLVLVCNMTPTLGQFTGAFQALILTCQSTIVAVNNPALWDVAVPGGQVGKPVRPGAKRVIDRKIPKNKILIFNSATRQLRVYPSTRRQPPP